jgi:hypothetical protein
MRIEEFVSMRPRFLLTAALALAAALPTGVAQAHHSYAMFVQFKWTNPHAWLMLSVKDASGAETVWNIEMNSPNNLAGIGWKRTSLKAGDAVTITVHPLRDGKAGGSFMSVVTAGGETLKG